MKVERLPSESMSPELIEMMIEDDILKSIGFNMRHIETEFQGKRVRTLFGSIAFCPIEQTFHEFLIDVLKRTLGEEWGKEQLSLQEDQRHFIMRCFVKFESFLRSSVAEEAEDGKKTLVMNGYARWFISLAFDVYSLVHTNQLPPTLVERLKDYNEFQGARYEIAIAAIFARMGYKISFYEGAMAEKHGEFTATHSETKEVIVIEAKSRQRKGVLHHGGERDVRKSLKGDVHALINQALKKEVGNNPFIVFVDVNAPRISGDDPNNIQWVNDYRKVVKSGLVKTAALESGKCSAIVITNFSDHYEEDGTARHPEGIMDTDLGKKKCYVIDVKIVEKVLNAIRHYGFVPSFLK